MPSLTNSVGKWDDADAIDDDANGADLAAFNGWAEIWKISTSHKDAHIFGRGADSAKNFIMKIRALSIAMTMLTEDLGLEWQKLGSKP